MSFGIAAFCQKKNEYFSELMPLANIYVIIIDVGEGSVGLYLSDICIQNTVLRLICPSSSDCQTTQLLVHCSYMNRKIKYH